MSDGVPDLAENLNFLFRFITDADGRPYSNNKVADALHQAGYSTSAAYLSQLRSGARNNPSAMLISGLANLFGVKIDYFFDPEVTQSTQEEIVAVTALRDKHIFTRTAGATKEGLARALRRALKDLEQGDDETEDDDGDDSIGPDHGQR